MKPRYSNGEQNNQWKSKQCVNIRYHDRNLSQLLTGLVSQPFGSLMNKIFDICQSCKWE